MLDVTVVRSKRYRGIDKGSRLLRSDGTRCCLGFAELAAGTLEENILGIGIPANVRYGSNLTMLFEKSIQPFDPIDWVLQNDICYGLIRANDSEEINDQERETIITDLGASVGIRFNFID